MEFFTDSYFLWTLIRRMGFHVNSAVQTWQITINLEVIFSSGSFLVIIFDNIVCSISLSVISMVLFTYLLVSIKKKRRFDQISPLAYTDHSDLLAEYQQHHQ